MKTRLSSLAVAGLLAASLTACGGGVSTDASEEDFCGGFDDLESAFSEVDLEDPDSFITALKDGAEDIRDTGVPEDAGDEVAEGLDVTTQAILDLPDDIDFEDPDSFDVEADFSDSEQEAADALEDYIEETCGDADSE